MRRGWVGTHGDAVHDGALLQDGLDHLEDGLLRFEVWRTDGGRERVDHDEPDLSG